MIMRKMGHSLRITKGMLTSYYETRPSHKYVNNAIITPGKITLDLFRDWRRSTDPTKIARNQTMSELHKLVGRDLYISTINYLLDHRKTICNTTDKNDHIRIKNPTIKRMRKFATAYRSLGKELETKEEDVFIYADLISTSCRLKSINESTPMQGEAKLLGNKMQRKAMQIIRDIKTEKMSIKNLLK